MSAESNRFLCSRRKKYHSHCQSVEWLTGRLSSGSLGQSQSSSAGSTSADTIL